MSDKWCSLLSDQKWLAGSLGVTWQTCMVWTADFLSCPLMLGSLQMHANARCKQALKVRCTLQNFLMHLFCIERIFGKTIFAILKQESLFHIYTQHVFGIVLFSWLYIDILLIHWWQNPQICINKWWRRDKFEEKKKSQLFGLCLHLRKSTLHLPSKNTQTNPILKCVSRGEQAREWACSLAGCPQAGPIILFGY